jgi:hypothetical protein
MALSSLAGLGTLGPALNTGYAAQNVTTRAEASFEETLINITTRDGDTVTLRHSTGHAALSQGMTWQNASSQGMSFSGQVLDTHAFSYTVQGELSATELQDLAELFDTLAAIAADFFQGHLDEALAGASTIGDTGSLAAFSATFLTAEITATRSSSQIAGVAEVADDENALARHRQAQWQQILAYLEARREGASQPPAKAAQTGKDHRQEMLAHLQKSLERHPRLTPLLQQLAAHAIRDQQAQAAGRQTLPTHPPEAPQQTAPRPAGSLWV